MLVILTHDSTSSQTGKFMKTFTSTTSVESSLQAAADEVELNEDLLRRNKAKISNGAAAK